MLQIKVNVRSVFGYIKWTKHIMMFCRLSKIHWPDIWQSMMVWRLAHSNIQSSDTALLTLLDPINNSEHPVTCPRCVPFVCTRTPRVRICCLARPAQMPDTWIQHRHSRNGSAVYRNIRGPKCMYNNLFKCIFFRNNVCISRRVWHWNRSFLCTTFASHVQYNTIHVLPHVGIGPAAAHRWERRDAVRANHQFVAWRVGRLVSDGVRKPSIKEMLNYSSKEMIGYINHKCIMNNWIWMISVTGIVFNISFEKFQ